MSMYMANISSVKSSLTNITHLSDDVLVEIFIRLPSRSVALCRCVSKRWLDLISGPSFLRLFISRQHSLFKTLLIFLSPHELMLTFPPLLEHVPVPVPTQNPVPSSLDSRLFNGQNQTQIQTLLSPAMLIKGNVCGCSSGLLLCSNNRYTSGRGYFVYDPFTKKCIQIPPSPVTLKECIYAVGFVCDPYNYVEPTTGTLNRNPSFRVVIIPSFIIRLSQFRVEIFSSETKEWIQQIVSLPNGFAFAPHWLLSYDYEGWLYFMGRTSIFVYDPYGHDSDTLDYPPDADPMNIMSFGFLGSSCGSLRIADIGPNDLRVWELTDDDNWHLLHKTNLTSTNLPAKFCADYYKRIGGFHPHDGDIVYLCSYADGIFVANLRTNKFEAIPGYEKSDMSPFQLELPLLTPPMPSPE